MLRRTKSLFDYEVFTKHQLLARYSVSSKINSLRSKACFYYDIPKDLYNATVMFILTGLMKYCLLAIIYLVPIGDYTFLVSNMLLEGHSYFLEESLKNVA